MSETCYNVPPDRTVVVLDNGDPAGMAAALIAAAEAGGLPVRSVVRAPHYGGFYVPASIANVEPPPQGPVLDATFTMTAVGLTVTITPVFVADADGPWITMNYDFGDAASGTGGEAAIDHTYAAPGTYTVTSIATWQQGVPNADSDTFSDQITVS